MSVLLPVILVASHLGLASRVPSFNIAPTCGFDRSNREACLRDEQQARGELKQKWKEFTRADRVSCVQSAGLGGDPSYVELLTCLQIAKQAHALPKADRMNDLLPP